MLFLLLLVSEAESPCGAQAGLDRPSAGIVGVCHCAQVKPVVLLLLFS